MPRKLKISLASNVAGHPIIASILLDGQTVLNAINVTASPTNYSTYEFDVSTGNHTLGIRCDNESLERGVDLNLIVGPIQLSKLDGTYHENLYLVPDPAKNLHLNADPNFLYTRTLFFSGEIFEFSFDSENPTTFRNYDQPLPPHPDDFETITGQLESAWVDGQVTVVDELKYQYSSASNGWILIT